MQWGFQGYKIFWLSQDISTWVFFGSAVFLLEDWSLTIFSLNPKFCQYCNIIPYAAIITEEIFVNLLVVIMWKSPCYVDIMLGLIFGFELLVNISFTWLMLYLIGPCLTWHCLVLTWLLIGRGNGTHIFLSFLRWGLVDFFPAVLHATFSCHDSFLSILCNIAFSYIFFGLLALCNLADYHVPVWTKSEVYLHHLEHYVLSS